MTRPTRIAAVIYLDDYRRRRGYAGAIAAGRTLPLSAHARRMRAAYALRRSARGNGKVRLHDASTRKPKVPWEA